MNGSESSPADEYEIMTAISTLNENATEERINEFLNTISNSRVSYILTVLEMRGFIKSNFERNVKKPIFEITDLGRSSLDFIKNLFFNNKY
jgi:DNA-binding PadR family transcriptional regulator